MSAADKQQILIDVQLKNSKIVADLKNVQRSINDIIKQEDELRQASERDTEALERLDTAMEMLAGREKYLIDQLEAQNQAMKTSQVAMQEMTKTSETLDKIHGALAGEFTGASKKLDELRKALSDANAEEKRLLDSGKATDVELNEMNAVIGGLEKAIKEVTKDVTNWVKELSLAKDEIDKVDSGMKSTADSMERTSRSAVSSADAFGMLDQLFGRVRVSGMKTRIVFDMLRGLLSGSTMGIAGAIASFAIPGLQHLIGGLNTVDEEIADTNEYIVATGKNFNEWFIQFKKLHAQMAAKKEFDEAAKNFEKGYNAAEKARKGIMAYEKEQLNLGNHFVKVGDRIKLVAKNGEVLYDSNIKKGREFGFTLTNNTKKWEDYLANIKKFNENQAKQPAMADKVGNAIVKYNETIITSEKKKRTARQIGHKETLDEMQKVYDFLEENEIRLNKVEQKTLEDIISKKKDYMEYLNGILAKRQAFDKKMHQIAEKANADLEDSDWEHLQHMYDNEKKAERELSKLIEAYTIKQIEEENKARDKHEAEVQKDEEWEKKELEKFFDWKEKYEEQRQKEIEDFEKEEMRQRQELFDFLQKDREKELAERKKWHDKQLEIDKAFAMQSVETFKGMFDAIHTSITNSNNEHLTNLENQYKLGLMTAANYEEQRIRITEEGNKKARKIAIVAALAERTKASFTVVLESMKSIAELVAMEPMTMGMPQAALVKAMMAMQLATIWAQPLPTAKKGGEVGGEKHEKGGTIIEAEKGEYIVSASAYEGNKNVIQAINGGMNFNSMMNSYENKLDLLLDGIKNIQVVATISSIEKAQENYNYLKYTQ